MSESCHDTHIVADLSWITALVDLTVECVEPLNVMGRFGYRYLEPSRPENATTRWLIAIYPTPNEAFGGSVDGALVFPGFSLDLSRLLRGFDRIEGIGWNAPTVYNGDLDGPEVSVKGDFAGRPVWVRIFSQPPNDVDPTMVVDLATGSFWEKSG